MTDITDAKVAEQRLSDAEARYRMLVEHFPGVTYLEKPDESTRFGYRAIFVSPQVETMLGHTAEEWLADPDVWLTWVHPEDRERVERYAEGVRDENEPISLFSIEYRQVEPSGEVIWLSDEAYPVADPNDEIVYWQGIILDITAQKLAEEERIGRLAAESANRSKSEFLSRMSHEFRTPLNAVLGFAQLLDMGELDPAQADNVEQISRAGHHLLDLIDDVLDISRIEAGRIPMWIEPLHLGEVLRGCIDLVRPLADARNIRISGEPEAGWQGFVLADAQRLKQVLLNLLANAIKYNREGGVVAVHATDVDQGRLLTISVSDTGGGIAADQLERAFAPFERLGAEQLRIEGTGLGLTLSRNLVEAMGGNLTVESAVGEGSTFSAQLLRPGPPLALPDVEPPSSASKTDVSERKRTILYVEDNASNLLLVQRILEMVPDTLLLSAGQGSLGLDLAREHRPDLILLDLHLPDLEGEEVLRRLREDPKTCDIKTVILTADASPDQAKRLLAAGAHAYLTKPLDVAEFLKVLG